MIKESPSKSPLSLGELMGRSRKAQQFSTSGAAVELSIMLSSRRCRFGRSMRELMKR